MECHAIKTWYTCTLSYKEQFGKTIFSMTSLFFPLHRQNGQRAPRPNRDKPVLFLTDVIFLMFLVNLLLTPFKLMILPPPMSTHTVKVPSAINMISFGVQKYQHNAIVQLSNKQFYLLNYSYDKKQYNFVKVTSDENILLYSLRHMIWVDENKIVVVADHKQGNSLLVLTLSVESDAAQLSMR